MNNNLEETYDAVVIGAGHAGCEAALALARMGIETIIFTVSMDILRHGIIVAGFKCPPDCFSANHLKDLCCVLHIFL